MRRLHARRMAETEIHHPPDRVRNAHLLCQPDGKEEQPRRAAPPVKSQPLELRHDQPVMQHRSGDQVREERDEEQIPQKARRRGLAPRSVHQIRNLGEGEKRNPQRQRLLQDRLLQQAQLQQQRGGERPVFEIQQHPQVQRQPRAIPPSRPAVWPVDKAGDPVVRRHRSQKQNEPLRSPPSVKHHRRQRQRTERHPQLQPAARHIERQPRQRQEDEDEFERGEEHASSRSFIVP